MGKPVSVDVPHKLGAEEAERRVRSGFGMMRDKLGDKLSAVDIVWGQGRADLTVTAMGQTLKGVLEFLPEAVRVTIDLPWLLATIGESIAGKIAKKTEEVLRPAPQGIRHARRLGRSSARLGRDRRARTGKGAAIAVAVAPQRAHRHGGDVSAD